jgi:hypothetical protein
MSHIILTLLGVISILHNFPLQSHTAAEETRITPITDHEKNGEREKQKCMRGSEKGS